MSPDDLVRLTGGELALRYLECQGRYVKHPDWGWLRLRLDETGAEIDRRLALGMLSPGLCGLLRHIRYDEGGVPPCDCASE